ncbi:MAG: hypothetical protein KAZ30_00570 [Candidatus Magasanikbacteria bacterium]|nr:hypothetical protein [Candidatus Magasanikbacteria bacterium]
MEKVLEYLIAFTALLMGALSMGFTITHVHAFVHIGGLRKEKRPITIGLYGYPHLQHHRDIPHTVELGPTRPGLLEYIRIGRMQRDLRFVWQNLCRHSRWTPMRLLIGYRTIRMMLTTGIAVSLFADLTTAFGYALLVSGAYMVGSCLMFGGYDLWHLWTHINGPFVSHHHAVHHGAQRRGLGMWFWNDLDQPKKSRYLRLTIAEVHIAEFCLGHLMPARRSRWQTENAALESKS